MRQDDASFPRRPFKDAGIIDLPQSDVLNAHQVQRRHVPQNATDQIVVQILVRQQPNHGSARLRVPSSKEARAHPPRIETAFNFGPEQIGLFLARGQIRFDFGGGGRQRHGLELSIWAAKTRADCGELARRVAKIEGLAMHRCVS